MMVASVLQAWLQAAPILAAEFTMDSARVAADKGDARAQYFLGKHYSKGDGVPRDDARAAGYLRQSAEQGYAFAQNDLGALYAQGLGVAQDYPEAARWFRKAALQGDPLAQYSLGLAYEQGRGVPKDLPEALKWYLQAADKNQLDALLALGEIHMVGGNGIKIDFPASRRWFKKAAAQGSVSALNSLAFLYGAGAPGLDQNIRRAQDYYRQAAEKNDATGQYNLGRFCLEISGAKHDPVEAYKWFYLAFGNGEGLANRYLHELDGSLKSPFPVLTAEQINEAIRQARAFQKSFKNKSAK